MKSAVFGIIIFIIFILVLLFGWTTRTSTPNSSAVVLEIQKLNRLETASFTIEKIIDAGTKGNVFSDILFGDRILLIAHGEVIAGFDFSKLDKNNIKISGTTLDITLPPPQILSSKLNNDQTRVYDRESGILTKGNKDLESEARKTAEVTIIEAACKANILDTASENGRKQLATLFKALGFQTIKITIPQGKCL
jgi:hypothetical protein